MDPREHIARRERALEIFDPVVALEQRAGVRVPDDERGRAALHTPTTSPPSRCGAPELPALRTAVAWTRADRVAVVRISGAGALGRQGPRRRPTWARADAAVAHPGPTLDGDLGTFAPPVSRNRVFIEARRHGWASHGVDAVPVRVPA